MCSRLSAQFRVTEEGFRENIDLCLQALAIDPGYADAHAGFGWGNYLLWIHGYDRRDEIWAKARAAGERALELDPEWRGDRRERRSFACRHAGIDL